MNILGPEDTFACSIACLAHDLGHSKHLLLKIVGKNNTYQLNARNKLSRNAHEASILEHMHAGKMLELLGNDATNALKIADAGRFKTLKTNMVFAILSTDMA